MQSANFTCMMMMSILCHHFFSFFEEKKQIKQWLLSENNLPFYLPTYLHTQVIIIKVNNNHCKKKMFFWFWCWLIFFSSSSKKNDDDYYFCFSVSRAIMIKVRSSSTSTFDLVTFLFQCKNHQKLQSS